MSIYRGVGGANEATDLATNQAVIAKSYAEQAAQSATEVNQTYNEFLDIYLGDFSSNPTTDNQGDSLQVGALYFNTTDKLLRVYDGTNWLVSAVSEPSSFTRNTFSGTGSQTVFTLSTTPVNNDSVFVFISGILISAYNVSGTTLTFTSAPASGTNNILAIVASTVSTLAPADNSVSTSKLQDGAVTTSKIADSQVTTAKIGNSQVTLAKLAGNSVDSSKIVDGSVGSAELASNAVTTIKITDGNITEAKLATGAVSTAKIADLAITTAKINDSAVTGAKLESITTDATVGTSSTIPVITFDSKGRVTSASTQQVTSINRGSSVTTNGLAFYDITLIPSGVKRLDIIFNGVSTNGSAPLQIQLGTSSGVESTGYISGGSNISTAIASTSSTAGLLLGGNGSPSHARTGIMTITNMAGNIWVASFSGTVQGAESCISGGIKTLSGQLDRIRIIATNGTDLFDAGAINITWEF